MKLNPCVTGDTKVLTIDGVKSFKELAEKDEDVFVLCLDDCGKIAVSKMVHPRISGYNMELIKVTLEDGSAFKVTPNHQFLTTYGYTSASELFEDDEIIVGLNNDENNELSVDEKAYDYCHFTGTKKGTIIKKCEVSGEDFECGWDEREQCSKLGNEDKLYEKLVQMKNKIGAATKEMKSMRITCVEYLSERENVYNGTVAVYHNYFTTCDTTNTSVNQVNCGE